MVPAQRQRRPSRKKGKEEKSVENIEPDLMDVDLSNIDPQLMELDVATRKKRQEPSRRGQFLSAEFVYDEDDDDEDYEDYDGAEARERTEQEDDEEVTDAELDLVPPPYPAGTRFDFSHQTFGPFPKATHKFKARAKLRWVHADGLVVPVVRPFRPKMEKRKVNWHRDAPELTAKRKKRAFKNSGRREQRKLDAPTIYELVAGRIRVPQERGTGHVPRLAKAVTPTEYYFSRKHTKLVHRDEEEAERVNWLPQAEREDLPNSNLLTALHQYTTHFYVSDDPNIHRFMDETALLALGVLMEETMKDSLGETGHLALLETPCERTRDDGDNTDSSYDDGEMDNRVVWTREHFLTSSSESESEPGRGPRQTNQDSAVSGYTADLGRGGREDTRWIKRAVSKVFAGRFKTKIEGKKKVYSRRDRSHREEDEDEDDEDGCWPAITSTRFVHVLSSNDDDDDDDDDDDEESTDDDGSESKGKSDDEAVLRPTGQKGYVKPEVEDDDEDDDEEYLFRT